VVAQEDTVEEGDHVVEGEEAEDVAVEVEVDMVGVEAVDVVVVVDEVAMTGKQM
jgi:hypothetical protein